MSVQRTALAFLASRRLIWALILAVLAVGSLPAAAMDGSSLPESKRTALGLYLRAEEVPGFLAAAQGKVVFLDVRAPAELMFVGMPTAVDANVPLAVGPIPAYDDTRHSLKMAPNPHFVGDVERQMAVHGLTKDDPVVLICRSGDRSAQGVNILAKAGFTHAWSVVDGFEGDLAQSGPQVGQRVVNGWKNKGLAWTYSLDKAKMYLMTN